MGFAKAIKAAIEAKRARDAAAGKTNKAAPPAATTNTGSSTTSTTPPPPRKTRQEVYGERMDALRSRRGGLLQRAQGAKQAMDNKNLLKAKGRPVPGKVGQPLAESKAELQGKMDSMRSRTEIKNRGKLGASEAASAKQKMEAQWKASNATREKDRTMRTQPYNPPSPPSTRPPRPGEMGPPNYRYGNKPGEMGPPIPGTMPAAAPMSQQEMRRQYEAQRGPVQRGELRAADAPIPSNWKRATPSGPAQAGRSPADAEPKEGSKEWMIKTGNTPNERYKRAQELRKNEKTARDKARMDAQLAKQRPQQQGPSVSASASAQGSGTPGNSGGETVAQRGIETPAPRVSAGRTSRGRSVFGRRRFGR